MSLNNSYPFFKAPPPAFSKFGLLPSDDTTPSVHYQQRVAKTMIEPQLQLS